MQRSHRRRLTHPRWQVNKSTAIQVAAPTAGNQDCCSAYPQAMLAAMPPGFEAAPAWRNTYGCIPTYLPSTRSGSIQPPGINHAV